MRQKQKLCIFCGGTGMSKEHFWPEWTSMYLPVSQSNAMVEVKITKEWNGKVSAETKRERQGHTWNKTLRVVCESCNNGWMSQIEEKSKPILIPLITGQKVYLGYEEQKAIGVWIALKAMVAEQSIPEDVVTSSVHRQELYASQRLPANFKIWLGRCDDPAMQAAYFRKTAFLTKPQLPPPTSKGQNTHSFCFGVGKLFIFALHSIDQYVANRLIFNLPHLSELNSQGTLEWPPVALSQKMAYEIAHGNLNPLNRFNISRLPIPT